MTALIGFVALLVIALMGWGIAMVKYKFFGYKVNQEEAEGVAHELSHHAPAENELGIKDVVKTISSKGFEAV